MDSANLLLPDTRTILLATAVGVLLAFLILLIFFRLHVRGVWNSAGSMRKRLVASSLLLYTLFLTTLFPLFAVKIEAGQSLRDILWIGLFFNGFAAVLVVEGVKALGQGLPWSMMKQVSLGVTGWVGLSLLMFLVAFRMLMP